MDIGVRVYDRWSCEFATVVAGAQADGHISIQFDRDSTIVAVRERDLITLDSLREKVAR